MVSVAADIYRELAKKKRLDNAAPQAVHVYCDAAGFYRQFRDGKMGMSGYRIAAYCQAQNASMHSHTRQVGNHEIAVAESIAVLMAIEWAANSFAKGKHIIVFCDNKHALKPDGIFYSRFCETAKDAADANSATFETRHIHGRLNLADPVSRGLGLSANHDILPPFFYRRNHGKG